MSNQFCRFFTRLAFCAESDRWYRSFELECEAQASITLNLVTQVLIRLLHSLPIVHRYQL